MNQTTAELTRLELYDDQLLTASGIGSDIFAQWINYLDVKDKTAQTYTRAIRQFAYFLEDQAISRPTREDVLLYRETLRASRKPATIQAYMTAVKLFFSWTDLNGIYPNISQKIKGARIEKSHKKDPLTVKQASRVLNAINRKTLSGLRDYAILTLMLTSGLRTIEVSRALIGDLRTVGDFTALFIQGKGRDEKSEYIKIAEPVEEAIRAYLTARKETSPEAPLFVSDAHRNAGGGLTTRSISRIVKESFRAVGLDSDRLTAHSLRHTAATLNLLNGGTVEETQQLLRHSNINTTLIYSHALERAQNNSESRIATAIFS